MNAYKRPIPTTAEGFLEEAKFYAARKRDKDAEEMLRKGVDVFGDDANLWSALGQSLSRVVPNAEATECFVNAWMIDPSPARTLKAANALTSVGRCGEAKGMYFDLYHQPANSPRAEVLTGLGGMYRKLGEKGLAAACFKKAADEGNQQAASALANLAKKGTGYVRENWEAVKEMARTHAPATA